MKKLSANQLAILKRMVGGETLTQYFGISFNKPIPWFIGKSKVHSSTVQALIDAKLVEYAYMKHTGTTEHFYRLTDAGKEDEEELTPEEKARIYRMSQMMNGMEAAQFHKQLGTENDSDC